MVNTFDKQARNPQFQSMTRHFQSKHFLLENRKGKPLKNSHLIAIQIPNGAENVFLSIVQAVTEVLNKSNFSLQMGNCPIPLAEHSIISLKNLKNGKKSKLYWWYWTCISIRHVTKNCASDHSANDVVITFKSWWTVSYHIEFWIWETKHSLALKNPVFYLFRSLFIKRTHHVV